MAENYNRVLKKFKAEAKVRPNNKKLIIKFLRDCSLGKTGKEIKDARLIKYVYLLKQLDGLLKKDFDRVSESDIDKLIETINKNGFADWTRHDYFVSIKKFYKWLGKEAIVKWIPNIRPDMEKTAEAMLTEEEVIQIVNAIKNPRDRFFCGLLWETGARASELLDLKFSQIKEEGEELKITFHGKTGTRTVPILSSAPLYYKWKELHPNPIRNESVWLGKTIKYTYKYNKNGQEKKSGRKKLDKPKHIPLTYRVILNTIKEKSKDVGIDKATNLHAWRHSRASYLANHLTEAQMCYWFGWAQGSNMPSTYIHLSDKQVTNAYRLIFGKGEKVEQTIKTKIKKCFNCASNNSFELEQCSECGSPLEESEYRKWRANQDEWKQEMQRKMETLEASIRQGLSPKTSAIRLTK